MSCHQMPLMVLWTDGNTDFEILPPNGSVSLEMMDHEKWFFKLHTKLFEPECINLCRILHLTGLGIHSFTKIPPPPPQLFFFFQYHCMSCIK